eukprot:TRINITY_DN21599_c0_g1_i1.p1 TRINITY_DN21599_c0_g1~~TRINITY_DN21599_c0_g1_i1.p1  ORF type:complete len:169 (-),score=8.44 TRINITY_DN21599_c0_g1_i1:61-567(-)
MAGKNYLTKHAYRFFAGDTKIPMTSDPSFEFDEIDLWNCHPVPSESKAEFKKQIPSSRISKKPTKRSETDDRTALAPSSMPVNIPDWSKILREDYRDNRKRENENEGEDDEDGDGEDNRIPPHEFLARQFARTRIASFSVHEGIGRTLKGRDLSRVRNAIWEQTGFED